MHERTFNINLEKFILDVHSSVGELKALERNHTQIRKIIIRHQINTDSQDYPTSTTVEVSDFCMK